MRAPPPGGPLPMPLDGDPLPALAATIIAAHSAAARADTIATAAIRVWLRKTTDADRGIAEARRLIPPEKWLDFVAGLGLTRGEARRHVEFPARAFAKPGSPYKGTLPTTVTGARQLLEEIERALDTLPPARLAEIRRVADAIRFLFWDAADIRERALDIAWRAAARATHRDCRQAALGNRGAAP
jgi:hypothetical protein